MRLDYERNVRQQGGGEVRNFEHANLIEGLWMVLSTTSNVFTALYQVIAEKKITSWMQCFGGK